MILFSIKYDRKEKRKNHSHLQVRLIPPVQKNKEMITYKEEKCNTSIQEIYHNFVNMMNFHHIKCDCQLGNTWHRHGYYQRSLKIRGEVIVLSVLRIKCIHCGKTHVILPSFIVPYSQIKLNDYIRIIANTTQNEIMNDNYLIDENNIKYIKNNINNTGTRGLPVFRFCFVQNQ